MAGVLPLAGQSLDLTPSLRAGLRAITILAFLSFITSSLLFFYLTYKLVWYLYLKPNKERQSSQLQSGHRPEATPQNATEFALGIDGVFGQQQTEEVRGKDDEYHHHLHHQQDRSRRGSTKHTTTTGGGGGHGVMGKSVTTTTEMRRPTSSSAAAPGADGSSKKKGNPPNQFLILLLNLLLADMHQGVAFLLNVEWLRRDEILVDSPTCFTQGLFVSTGDLASSCFITTIAIHAYVSVVRQWKPSSRSVYLSVAAVWLFVYLISMLPIAATANGASAGGFFVRAGSWCWMNNEYSELRLLTHYLFIFIAITITSTLYTLIFIHLRRLSADEQDEQQAAAARNPAFLIYPIIYVICTLPLALGRIASMTGADVPLGYMCFAGAMISSNGFFDCLLFGTTRNVLVFASKHDLDKDDTGLNTFNFTLGQGRRYGNMVWVQGGDGAGRGGGADGGKRGGDKVAGGWWSWQRLGGGSGSDTLSERVLGHHHPHHKHNHSRSVSQESLRGTAGAIQMDTVTSVVVELDHTRERDPRYPDPNASMSSSVNSAEKDYQRA